MHGNGNNVGSVVKFGRSTLWLDSGDLVVSGHSSRLGRRTVALLLTLLEADGKVVSKDEILQKVWQGTIIEENTLQVQISALRKALGEDRGLLQTVSGRGYRMLTAYETVHAPRESLLGSTEQVGDAPSTSNLPVAFTPLIGREHVIVPIYRTVARERLVTLSGPAGIGKTRLSLEVARECIASFPSGAFCVELAAATMPEEVFQAVAGALGLPASIQTSERIARAIGDKTLLVLLDNCEHVVEAAAVMAEAILHLTPYAHVLATSREPLRADCEHVIIVPPLEVPAEGVHEREIIVRTGAVRLFLDRAIAAGLTAAFDDSTYDAIGEICRRLDGIPLALELAAARAATLGIDQVLRRLNDRFRLLSTGLRTALPRHQTLRAAIDWSYEQLNPLERQVFERISIFTGSFDTNAGVAIGTSVGESESSTLETIGDLASKSLLVPNLTGALALYRLLETLRIYARERLTESGQEQAVALSHALYFKELLLDAERKLRELNAADWVLSFGRHVTEVRAALNWAYAQPEQSLLAVELTILAIEMWGQLSLERESATWAEKVLALVPDDDNATHLRCKMKLYVSLGKNWTYGMGSRPRAKSDYSTGYELAVQMQDIDYALRATWGLIATAIAYGEYVEGLALSDRFCELAKDSRDPFDAVAGDRTRGVLLYLSNDLPQAQRFLMRSLDANDYQNMTADRLRYGVDIRSAARYTLAHVLWLRGLADQAIATMEQNVQDAEVVGHAYTICSVLGASSVPLCIFTGRLEDACRYNERLRAFAAKHGLDHWVDASEFFHGVIQVKQGRAASGLESIRAGEKRLTHLSFLPSYFIPVRANLGEALCLLGRVDEGLEAIHSCFSPENLCNRTWYVPEVLRMQGEAILKTARRDRFDEAKALFEQALSRANIQGSVSFELRAANSLAALHIKQSNHAAARDILAPIFRHFVEGFSTPDLREAVRLLGAAGIA